jgi:hypothetical protein
MKTNHFFRTLVLSIFILISFKIKAQTTDFNMSFLNPGPCTSVTIKVLSGATVLWSGSPFTGSTCITGGTPNIVRIIDGSCDSFDITVNVPMTKSGNLCPGSCLVDTPDNPPISFYGFYAALFNVGGFCASPSGILSLTMYPMP